MASTQANTWPPLIGPRSWDNEKQRQLYGEEVFASAKILDSNDDEFFHPVNRGLSGYSYEGILYQNGAEVPGAPRASWFTEAPGPFRGQDASFPRLGMVLATDAGLSILNNETGRYTLWMMAMRRDDSAFTHNFLQGMHGATPDKVTYRNGRIVVSLYPDAGAQFQVMAFLVFDFVQDQIYLEWARYKLPILTAYTTSPAHYPINQPITPNVCGMDGESGGVTSWDIIPPLPEGLVLDSATGIISGTPTQLSPAEVYTITARNTAGAGTCLFIMDVRDPLVVLTPVKISMGYRSLFVIMDSGEVWAAGLGGDDPQVGLPAGNVVLLRKTDLTNVADIAQGYYHNLVLKKDGTVWAWGNNYYGALGNGATTSSEPYRSEPIQVPIADVVAIAATAQGSIALKADGTVWTWGAISGTPTPASPNPNALGNSSSPSDWNGLTDVIAIAAGWTHWLALKQDGTVMGYGMSNFHELGVNSGPHTYNTKIMTTVVGPGTPIKAIACGFFTSYFVTQGGAVMGCGRDDLHQIGKGGYTITSPCPCVAAPQLIDATPASSLMSGVAQVVAGQNWAIARKSDGTSYSWGSGRTGAVATGIPPTYTNNDPINGTEIGGQDIAFTYFDPAVQLSGQMASSAALLQNNMVQTCGLNYDGMLAVGDTLSRTRPVQILLP